MSNKAILDLNSNVLFVDVRNTVVSPLKEVWMEESDKDVGDKPRVVNGLFAVDGVYAVVLKPHQVMVFISPKFKWRQLAPMIPDCISEIFPESNNPAGEADLCLVQLPIPISSEWFN